MSNLMDGGDVIHIIGGDEAGNQGGEGSGVATPHMAYGRDGSMVSDPSQIPTFGSSSFVMVEHDRYYKFRHCKQYYTEAGCPFGDNCNYIHDENAKARESLALILTPRASGGYRNVAPPPLPLAPPQPSPPARPLAAPATETAMLPLAQRPLLVKTVSSATLRPLYWRTRICSRWELSGYCQFGNKCIFAHGEAELRHYGGGLVAEEANQRAMVQNLAGNQQAIVQTLAAPSGPLAGHAVTAPAADADGSGQVSGAVQGPIPSRNAWKVPKELIGIYADWIDDLE